MSEQQEQQKYPIVWVNGVVYEAQYWEHNSVFFALVRADGTRMMFPWVSIKNVKLDPRWLEIMAETEKRRAEEAAKAAPASPIEIPQNIIIPK